MLTVHVEKGRVGLRRRLRPRRPQGFALIRLLCGGICNTDLELVRGYYAFNGTPGHEFVGEVTEADNPALVGRRVVGEISLACGTCDWCAKGLGRHCPHRTVLGIQQHRGAFGEYFTLPEANLYVLPDEISTERAIFTEPLAAACEIQEQVSIPPGAEVAVLGDGKLGLLVGQVLQAGGAKVYLFGKYPEKLRLATMFGIHAERMRRKPPQAAYDWVVEASGSVAGLRQAISMTRPRGTVIIKSTVHAPIGLDMAPVVVNELTLLGSRCGRFGPALELLASGKVCVEPLISARFALTDAVRAFRLAARPGVMKVLLYPGLGSSEDNSPAR